MSRSPIDSGDIVVVRDAFTTSRGNIIFGVVPRDPDNLFSLVLGTSIQIARASSWVNVVQYGQAVPPDILSAYRQWSE